eukprot:GHVQ01037602.1.p1 GENE.GHVQ01037602.1~~GHVQ01037602.1.p1  ORF type:complete len:117 (-),score=12.59 GHVQ01037602.1:495-845(-)
MLAIANPGAMLSATIFLTVCFMSFQLIFCRFTLDVSSLFNSSSVLFISSFLPSSSSLSNPPAPISSLVTGQSSHARHPLQHVYKFMALHNQQNPSLCADFHWFSTNSLCIGFFFSR